MINMEGLQIISLSKKDSFKLFNSQSVTLTLKNQLMINKNEALMWCKFSILTQPQPFWHFLSH